MYMYQPLCLVKYILKPHNDNISKQTYEINISNIIEQVFICHWIKRRAHVSSSMLAGTHECLHICTEQGHLSQVLPESRLNNSTTYKQRNIYHETCFWYQLTKKITLIKRVFFNSILNSHYKVYVTYLNRSLIFNDHPNRSMRWSV